MTSAFIGNRLPFYRHTAISAIIPAMRPQRKNRGRNRPSCSATAAVQTRRLASYSTDAWERLCDGCAMCCAHKLEFESTGRVVTTNIACPLLNLKTCRCGDYDRRQQLVPECVRLTPSNVPLLRKSLPPTCAYRRIAEGRPLPAWHPLRTGRRSSTAAAGMSARNRLLRLEDIPDPAAFLARSMA
jgi:hypothetical protein